MIKSCGLRSIKVDRGGYFPRKTSSWLEETDSIKYSSSATKSCSRSFDVLLDIKAAMLEGALAVTSLQGETSAGRAGGEKAEAGIKPGGLQASLLQILTWRGSIHPSPVLAAPQRSLGCSHLSFVMCSRGAASLQE